MDDEVLVGESTKVVGESLVDWRKTLEREGLGIINSKTKVIVFDFGESYRAQYVMQLDDDEVCEVDSYLG